MVVIPVYGARSRPIRNTPICARRNHVIWGDGNELQWGGRHNAKDPCSSLVVIPEQLAKKVVDPVSQRRRIVREILQHCPAEDEVVSHDRHGLLQYPRGIEPKICVWGNTSYAGRLK